MRHAELRSTTSAPEARGGCSTDSVHGVARVGSASCRVRVLERPAPVCPAATTDEVDRLGQSFVARRANRLEIVERPQNVVMPPGWKHEPHEFGLDDRPGSV